MVVRTDKKNASSALPVIFSPITLANFAGQCGFTAPQWMTRALRDRHDYVRRHAVASDLYTYLDADKRKYVHLLDGGHFLLESALDEVAPLIQKFLAHVLRDG